MRVDVIRIGDLEVPRGLPRRSESQADREWLATLVDGQKECPEPLKEMIATWRTGVSPWWLIVESMEAMPYDPKMLSEDAPYRVSPDGVRTKVEK